MTDTGGAPAGASGGASGAPLAPFDLTGRVAIITGAAGGIGSSPRPVRGWPFSTATRT